MTRFAALLALIAAAPVAPDDMATLPRPCAGRAASGPITVAADGQIVENLVIRATDGPALRVVGKRDVMLRNLTILHAGAAGIDLLDAPGATIENVDVYNVGAPPQGQANTAAEINIQCEGSRDLTVRNVRLQRGSSGVYLLECPHSRLAGVEGRDFRGPFPRGQLVQWDKSVGGTLSDFSAVNSVRRSWPEDIVNIYESQRISVARGVVDGNNSLSGDGVIVDQGSHDVTITDVDALRQMNGCFAVYGGGGYNVTMTRTRCSDTICRSARGRPLSNSLAWAIDPKSQGGIRIVRGRYSNLCNPTNILYDGRVAEVADIKPVRDQPLRVPYKADLCSARR